MSTTRRDLRGVFFFVVGTFIVLGPFRTQVLLLPSRTADKPWLPMAWQMYHGIGVNMCQAEFQNGARTPITHEVVQRAVGPTRQSRYAYSRKARAHDVLFVEMELAEIARGLCTTEPDVRAEMRCAPNLPGGKWRIVHDGTANLCVGRPPVPVLTPEAQPELGSD